MPSRARAAHLIVDDDPPIFADVLAAALLGDRADDLIGYHRAHGTHVVLAGARDKRPAGAVIPRTAWPSASGEGQSVRDPRRRPRLVRLPPRPGDPGEPWLTFRRPRDMSALLGAHGFGQVRHVRQRDAIDPECWQRTDSLRPMELSVLAHATVG